MIPFWEEAYKNEDILAFGTEPNKSILQIENMLKKSSNIIDVGCGDGTNVIYMARKGFIHVEGIDCSENGIKKLQKIIDNESLHINAKVADLCKFDFEKDYELIMSFGTLHFVSNQDWHIFIEKAKMATCVGGYNIIQIFTNQVPPSADIAPFAIGLSDDGEIKEMYEDWEIIEYKSYVFEDEHPGVPKHLHASNKIIAKRIK